MKCVCLLLPSFQSTVFTENLILVPPFEIYTLINNLRRSVPLCASFFIVRSGRRAGRAGSMLRNLMKNALRRGDGRANFLPHNVWSFDEDEEEKNKFQNLYRA